MKKKSELIFSGIQLPIDALMIFLAAISAFAIRNIPELLVLRPKLYVFSFNSYMKVVLLVVPIFLIIYALEGLYNIKTTRITSYNVCYTKLLRMFEKSLLK